MSVATLKQELWCDTTSCRRLDLTPCLSWRAHLVWVFHWSLTWHRRSWCSASAPPVLPASWSTSAPGLRTTWLWCWGTMVSFNQSFLIDWLLPFVSKNSDILAQLKVVLERYLNQACNRGREGVDLARSMVIMLFLWEEWKWAHFIKKKIQSFISPWFMYLSTSSPLLPDSEVHFKETSTNLKKKHNRTIII